MRITKNEKEVLNAIESTDLNDGSQTCLYGPLYHDNYDMNTLRGSISSLVKKGIIVVDEEDNSFGDDFEYTEIVVNSDYVEKDEEGYLTIINLEVA